MALTRTVSAQEAVTIPKANGQSVFLHSMSSLDVHESGSAASATPPAHSPLNALLSPTSDANPASSFPSPIAYSHPTLNHNEDPGRTPRETEPDADMQELSLEDDRFSTVPLSAAHPSAKKRFMKHSDEDSVTAATSRTPSRESAKGGVAKLKKIDSYRSGASVAVLVSPAPSATSTLPNGNAEFILARLEKDSFSPTRGSFDGKTLLKEEFANARKAKEEEVAEETNIDWDFWGNVMNDYERFARNEPKRLARAIEAGIPSALRGMIWQLMSASKDPELERTYSLLLKQTSPHEKAITRDLGRTFPHHAFFTDGHGVGQESLFNVLKAYSLYDPECGYCQGLPFVVAPLLLVSPDEEAFCQLVRLMQSYDLRGHFLPEMPGLQLRLFQFDRLIEDMLPVLHVHFLRQGVKSSMFCSQWFLTLFAYRFPLELVFRIFDHILATGLEAIFSFSVLLLQKNEQALLRLSFDQILEYLKTSLLDHYKMEEEPADGEDERFQVDNFVRDASNVKITPFQLDNYAAEYQELRRAQTAHLVEMDNLRNDNRQMKQRLKDLEDSLAQVNAEHCEIIKQLVMAKIEKEEMEGELVKYKLLYAETMHLNEESRSSSRFSSLSALLPNR